MKSVCMAVETGLDGIANFSAKIPGTFNGVADNCNGRFLKSVQVWADSPANGDRLHNARVEDSDLILQGLGLHVNFPNYPVLVYFEDEELDETSQIKKGFYIPESGALRMEKLDPRDNFDFIPSGMYLKGRITSTALKTFRINCVWGKSQ